MKIYLSLVLFISFTAFSQSKGSLQIAAKKIYDANFLMDFEGIKSFTYPKVYETIGDAAFVEQLENDFQNSEYRMRYQLEKVPMIMSEIKTSEGKSFCVVRFRNPKRYLYENKLNATQVAEKKAWLQEKEKTQNVTFEPARNSFNVRSESIYVAVFDVETMGEWKFFNLDDAFQSKIFHTLIDENIKNILGLNN